MSVIAFLDKVQRLSGMSAGVTLGRHSYCTLSFCLNVLWVPRGLNTWMLSSDVSKTTEHKSTNNGLISEKYGLMDSSDLCSKSKSPSPIDFTDAKRQRLW